MQQLQRLADDALVGAFKSGNNMAFDVLLERHQRRVYNYLLHLTKDVNLADDAFQETFIKVITTIKQGRYNADGKFISWITRIAHNIVIDHFRQGKSEAMVNAGNDDTNILNRRELSEGTIEDEIIEQDIRKDLRRLIRTLPTEQRQVLVMRYYGGMSFKEIAQRTGVSINTALGRMRYAILSLRRISREQNIELSR